MNIPPDPRHESPDPHERHRERDAETDRLLRETMHDTAAAITPTDRLHELRRRTTARSGRPNRRPSVPVLLGVGIATAAVVVGGVTIGALGSGSTDSADTPAAATTTADSAASLEPAALYFLGDSPTGTRLYREFGSVPGSGGSQAVLAAVRALSASVGPSDPDYRTAWPAGAFVDALVTDDSIQVEIDPTLVDPPGDLASGDAALALQQVVYTAEAVIGRTVPVEFLVGEASATRVFGIGIDAPVERDRQFATTAPVNISDPAEGMRAADVLRARGTVATTVDVVRWELSDASGVVVARGRADRADDGAGGATRYAPGWETDPIDLADLAPGDYVFTVRVRDTGQTTDRAATFVDDRTLTVP